MSTDRPRSARIVGAHVLLAAAAALIVAPAHADAQTPPARPAAAAAAATPEFTILIYESDAQLAERTSPTAADAYWTAYDRFAGELARAGVLRGGSALDERVRATVRGTGSADRAVPQARLGGYFVIAVRDRAAAEAWARKAPPRALAVEVRPHRANPHMAMMAGAAPAAP
jgi:hypothetical protein